MGQFSEEELAQLEFFNRFFRQASDDDLDQPIIKFELKTKFCVPTFSFENRVAWSYPGFWKEVVKWLPAEYIIEKITLKFRTYEKVVMDAPHKNIYIIDGVWRDNSGGHGNSISVGYGEDPIEKFCYSIPVICLMYQEEMRWEDVPEELRLEQDVV